MNLFNIMWSTTTAGPSLDYNFRTELFLFGCERAKKGNPCSQCFNSSIWDDSVIEYTYTPEEIANNIEKNSPNKYITISGGEPLDQIEELIELCKLLKAKDYHILVYTWRDLLNPIKVKNEQSSPEQSILFKSQIYELLNYIDILVDGEFDQSQNLYQSNKEDGLLNSVGSANQTIWDVKHSVDNNIDTIDGYKLGELDALALTMNNDLVYIVKDIDSIPKETKRIF